MIVKRFIETWYLPSSRRSATGIFMNPVFPIGRSNITNNLKAFGLMVPHLWPLPFRLMANYAEEPLPVWRNMHRHYVIDAAKS